MSHGDWQYWRCMKWNTEQLELGLNPYRKSHRSMQRVSQRRLQRASWWFEQMRRAVDNTASWPELDLDRSLGNDPESVNPLHAEDEDQMNEELIVGL